MINPIITLTDAAILHVKRVIEKKGSGIGFRLSIKQTGCSGYMYVPEIINEVKPDDVLVEVGQDLHVYLAPDCIEILQGTVLDFVEKSFGMKQLQFNNPNVNGLCGCGESFHLKDEK